jgi:hypothetical protein
MKPPPILVTAVFGLFVGCTDHSAPNSSAMAGDGPRADSRDLHPAPEVEVRRSVSEYTETMTIPAEWNGERYHNYTFNCESSTIESLLKFLYWNFEQSSPPIIGTEHLPAGLYRISFGSKKWDSKEAVVKDVMNAVESSFGLEITYRDSPRALIVRNTERKN